VSLLWLWIFIEILLILLFKKVGKLNSNVTFRNCTLLQSGDTQNGNGEVADLYNGK